jgi:hypothetical protein
MPTKAAPVLTDEAVALKSVDRQMKVEADSVEKERCAAPDEPKRS